MRIFFILGLFLVLVLAVGLGSKFAVFGREYREAELFVEPVWKFAGHMEELGISAYDVSDKNMRMMSEHIADPGNGMSELDFDINPSSGEHLVVFTVNERYSFGIDREFNALWTTD